MPAQGWKSLHGVEAAERAVVNQSWTIHSAMLDGARRISRLKAEMARRAKGWDVT